MFDGPLQSPVPSGAAGVSVGRMGTGPNPSAARHLGEEIVTTRIYTLPIEQTGWQVPGGGTTAFSWEYDQGRDRLLTLYEKGKHRQWNASERIDWSLEVDKDDPLGTPDEAISIYGSPTWDRLGQRERAQVRLHADRKSTRLNS